MANFTDEEIESVWSKAKPVVGKKESEYKQDMAGALIKRTEYGNTDSIYGWQIDHKFPERKGGDESPLNLQAMQWGNNDKKSDDFPDFMTSYTYDGMTNIKKEQSWYFKDEFIKKLKAIYFDNKYLQKIPIEK
ncbi:MAG: nuclease [Bacteroidetes bacterium]|nr:nuclease [Bacteroidota bacterium]